MRGRKIRKLEIERVMGRQGWSALELSEHFHISPLNMRRYLRRYLRSRRLVRKKFGVTWFYAVKRFFRSPNFSYQCPQCRAQMDVYKLPCGCEFQICGRFEREHSQWNYCQVHRGSIPRFEKIEVICHVCQKKAVVKLDRKENKILADWTYHGRMQLPGMQKKEDIFQCKACEDQEKIVGEE